MASQTVEYSETVYGTDGGGVLSSNDDLFDDVAPSTVAMVILFGSIMFATVGMATRAWLWGDQRAIRAAMSVKLNTTAPNINRNSGDHSYVGNVDEFDDNNSYSLASRMSTLTMGTSLSKTRIRPWEPTFISTFVLFYQTTLFGLILFMVYLIDNHPPHGAARSQKTYGLPSEFDEDQFLFWILVLVAYGFFVSWQRNDGRPNSDHKSNDGHKPHLPQASDPPFASKREKITRRRNLGHGLRHGLDASIASKSISGASSKGSDVSKRLEDVLLDDDDTSFNNILDTINGDMTNKSDADGGWLEQGSILLGLHLNANEKTGVIHDAKPEEDILNRYQTLEWKGFLSAALLIYQFNNGGIHQIDLNNEGGAYFEEGSTYENLTKCAMTAYLFLAGFGHTSYFYYNPANNHDSYRISRFLNIIFRINFISVFLSLVIGTMEYMACPVITHSFLLIWLTMRLHRSINYDKYLFRLKLFGLSVFIFIIWDCDMSKTFSHNVMQNPFRPIWEWYCLSHLHHWAAFCGMVFAINLPVASYQLRKLESLHILTNVIAKGFICFVLIVAVLIWAAGPLQMPRYAYNISHPYFGIVPLLAFIYLRNICGREHHVGIFSSLGNYSLEIYLLHHHAFTDSGCILLIPGYPRCNFALVVSVLLCTARVLHHRSIILRHMLLPENEDRKCVQHACSIVVGVAILYSLAKTLSSAEMLSIGTISTIMIVCGILVFQTVVDMTWAEYRDSGLKLSEHHDYDLNTMMDMDESSAVKISPPVFVTLVFVIAWCVWIFSGSALQPCNPNDGNWIHINPCLARGKMHREFHATNHIGPNECSDPKNKNLEWSWPENGQQMHCRYRYRNDMEVKRKLQGKKVVLIGDSSVRSLFQSICRSFDRSLGGFEDTMPSHSDSIKSYGSSTLEYKWAPLSVDIVTKLKGLKNTGFAASVKRHQPDLVVAGGGTWDRLHISLSDEDPQSQRDTVMKLAKNLADTASPVIWFTPPTINTQALNSDEKRVQMNEGSIGNMRQMYEELGVTSSVSFVLDGPSFTHDRVAESFDGVNYPPSIMDAGAQIIFNALDWLIVAPDSEEVDFYLPRPGSLGNPYLGLMMICMTLIGLFFFCGYFGLGYLAQLVVGGNDSVSPAELYDAAFAPIFNRLKISRNNEVEVAPTYRDSDTYEMTELLGRSTSSLSRRRAT